MIVNPSDPPPHRTPFGDTITWIAGEADTDHAYALLARFAPPGARSNPHVHSRLAEAFYVLEGAFDAVIGDERVEAGPGTFLLAPPGTLHGWSVLGDSPGRMLIMFSPSVTRSYFDELDRLMDESGGRPDPAALRRLAERHGWT